jgi:predicted PolB exonuclease-like 3'-5' exonuclease
MIKSFSPTTCAFDCEWVPCPATARRLLGLDPSCSDREAIQAAWRAYAKEGEERPFLKLVLSKVVTIAAVFRVTNPQGDAHLELFSADCETHGEAHLISSFLERVAGGAKEGTKWQLWGFNSAAADLPILKQRAVALNAPIPQFSKRPAKAWEGMDYHDSRNSEAHKDILEILGGFGGGAAKPKLHELAVACGFPGKLDVEGSEVADLYLDGRIAEIREYNETDAVTTHLLMLRLAHVVGCLSDDAYQCELLAVEKLVKGEAARGKAQFEEFLGVWRGAAPGAASRAAVASGDGPALLRPERAQQIRGQWKLFMGKVKAEHGPNLAAALQAVRNITVSGRTLTLYFGSNEFSRNMCLKHGDLLAATIGSFLEEPGLALEFALGEGPAR